MPNSKFHTAISKPRYERYLFACGSKTKALRLYRANIVLSQKMYAMIGVLEVILRNSIDRHMTLQKGPDWLENAAAPGGYLYNNYGCRQSLTAVQKALSGLGILYSHEQLITRLSFGFWKSQFAPKQFAASGSTLLEIFIHRPFGTNQKDIFLLLSHINEIRNRIAHYEPICFDGNMISTDKIVRRYRSILELLQWLGCDQNKMLYGIDGVSNAVDNIDCIKNSI